MGSKKLGIRVAMFCAAAGTMLSACGGGSDNNPPSPPPPPPTYSLSGTVSGLSSTGLALTVNGSEVSVPSGATTIALASSLASDAAYSVTVSTQPTGATCTVAGGSGAIASANVTNVAVSCSANTYTVGGSITGLTLAGLVPLVNGADSTSIAAHATQFTMTNRVTHGGSYAITVGTHPLPRSCAVTRGSGTALNDVTDVAITCTPPVVYSFNGPPDASSPGGSLLQASDGNFYGTSIYGGATGTGAELSGAGAVFRITPSGTETVLHSFTGGPSGGREPARAGLVEGSDGNFYGTTSRGGASNKGTVYRITPAGVFTLLHSFAGAPTDGEYPLAGLLKASDGNFYGTTFIGGANNEGALFKITPAGVESVVHSFSSVGGGARSPASDLIEANDGNFYGTSVIGGSGTRGTVFKVTPAGVATVLHSFVGPPGDGALPAGAALLEASDGNFYGVAGGGGTNDRGVVFRLTPAGVHDVLHSFNVSDGEYPSTTLAEGSNGTLYGATYRGGVSGFGTVFKLSSSGTLTTLYSFTDGTGDGNQPEGGLTLGLDGNLYGTTNAGGSRNHGTFFRIVPN